MSEGGEARPKLPDMNQCFACLGRDGKHLDDCIYGEARDHEAEVEAAIFDVLTREGVIFASRFPIGRVQAREFRQRVAKAIAALDAVRRSPQSERISDEDAAALDALAGHPKPGKIGSPQGEDQACDCGAKPGQPCYVDADGPQYHALRGVPQGEDHEDPEARDRRRLYGFDPMAQGEDHEAGIEAAMRAVYGRWPQMWGKDGKPKTYEECYGCAPLDNEDDRAEMEVAVDAYLSRCPSPEREPTQLGTVCEQCERRTMEPVYTEDGDAFCGRCAVQLAPERDTEKLAAALYRQDAAVLANQVEKLVEALRKVQDLLDADPDGDRQTDALAVVEEALAEFSDASKEKQ